MSSGNKKNDFAEYVRGEHPDVQSYHRYVLGQVRSALLRAKMLVNDIETIGTALADGWIGPDEALEELARAAALDFLLPAEPEWVRPPDEATTPVNSETQPP